MWNKHSVDSHGHKEVWLALSLPQQQDKVLHLSEKKRSFLFFFYFTYSKLCLFLFTLFWQVFLKTIPI
jgi:hypothetical protein